MLTKRSKDAQDTRLPEAEEHDQLNAQELQEWIYLHVVLVKGLDC